MLFNSLTFVVFFAVVVSAYWSIRSWTLRKNLLLFASYVFYGAWNPPFAALLFSTTVLELHARGGKIIFVRFLHSGELKALEDRLNPRAHEWERLLKETGAPGVYYEDYPELSSFICPDWSHLNAGDSVEFSKRLVPHPRTALQL